MFSLHYLPYNVYYYFIKPINSYPGVSFFVVSPIFLYGLKTDIKKYLVKLSIPTVALITFIYLIYYWPGWGQIGPRYLLECLPYAYIILLYSFKGRKLTKLAKAIILLSVFVNIFYVIVTYTLFDV